MIRARSYAPITQLKERRESFTQWTNMTTVGSSHFYHNKIKNISSRKSRILWNCLGTDFEAFPRVLLLANTRSTRTENELLLSGVSQKKINTYLTNFITRTYINNPYWIWNTSNFNLTLNQYYCEHKLDVPIFQEWD